MTVTPEELIARANQTVQSILGAVAEEWPVGNLEPDFLRRLRARSLVLDDSEDISGFRTDRFANKIYLRPEMVVGLRSSFLDYCRDQAKSHVPRSNLTRVPPGEYDKFAATMLDVFFALFLLHETLHETQRLTSYNYEQTNSFRNSIRSIDYAADKLSIGAIALLLRQSDWSAALHVSHSEAAVLRLIQAHCFGMAHFARLSDSSAKLTKSRFYRLMTWHVQFHRMSAVVRQQRNPLPLLDQEPVFDMLACDQIPDDEPFSAEYLLGKIDNLRRGNPPPRNFSVLVQPPKGLPMLERFDGSSPNSLQNLLRGIYTSSLLLTEPFLFELFDTAPGFLAVPDVGQQAGPVLLHTVAQHRDPSSSLTFGPISLATVEVGAKVLVSDYGLRLWGDPRSGLLALSVQGDLMEVARGLPDCADAVNTISAAFSVETARANWSNDRSFASKVRVLAPLRIANSADQLAVLHIPEQPERALPGTEAPIKYRVLTKGPRELEPGQSGLFDIDVSLYFDDPVIPDRHEDGRPWHLHSTVLLLLRLAKALRDRVASARNTENALPITLDFVDTDGSNRQAEFCLQIVEGLQALPEWQFDLDRLCCAFEKIDEIAVPAYRDKEQAKLRALIKENETLLTARRARKRAAARTKTDK